MISLKVRYDRLGCHLVQATTAVAITRKQKLDQAVEAPIS